VDRLAWKIVAAPLDEDDRSWLVAQVRAHLGDVDVEIQEVADIPVGRSGKFQYVISRS
jgi:hypothetical protein